MANKPSTEHADAKAAQARLEAARDSLTGRLEELARRFKSTRNEIEHKIDIKAHISEHPFPAVGIALAAGMLAGLLGGKKSEPKVVEEKTLQRRLGEALAGAIGTLILKLVREAAFGQLKEQAKRYFDERTGTQGSDVRYTVPYQPY